LWGSWQGVLGRSMVGRAQGARDSSRGPAARRGRSLVAGFTTRRRESVAVRAPGGRERGARNRRLPRGEVQGELRLHGVWRRGGVWGGAVVGQGWTDRDGEGRAVSGPALGGWVRASRATAAVTLTGTRLEGEWYPEVGFELAWSSGSLDASAVTGARGAFGAEPALGWASAAAKLVVHRPLGGGAAGRRFSGGPVQGLPRERRCPLASGSRTGGRSPCASCPSSVRSPWSRAKRRSDSR